MVLLELIYAQKSRCGNGKLNTPQGGGIPENAYPHVKGYLISLEDLVSVHWVDEPSSEHECRVCGYIKKTVHKAITNKEDQIWICETCVQNFEKKREA